jgi:23S rRNA pseudouridine1911/1915/1917 synthase
MNDASPVGLSSAPGHPASELPSGRGDPAQNDSGGELSFAVSGSDAGQRIDAFLARRSGRPRAVVQEALRDGLVTVSGGRVRPSHRLSAGEVVAGRLPQRPALRPGPEAIPLAVRYSDARVLVISKPPGLVVHPGAGHSSGTLVNALLALGEPLAATSTARPGIVHRLDKDTSGLLLVAKDDEAHSFLVRALRARAVERRYVCLVAGPMPAPTGTIDAPLGRHPRRPRLRAVVASGRAAVTHYRTLATGGGLALLDVALETGRTHQIRAHLAHIGSPVAGDAAYGAARDLARALGLRRPFLHAWRLAWPDPSGGGRRSVVDEVPADLTDVLERASLPLPR